MSGRDNIAFGPPNDEYVTDAWYEDMTYKCEHCKDIGYTKDKDPGGNIWITACDECDANVDFEYNCDNCQDTGFDGNGNECNKCDYLEDDND